MSGLLAYYLDRVPGLAKAGQEYRGPCPIHNGERDSFSVNPENEKWRCHSDCDCGGDAYELEMKLRGLSRARFGEAKRAVDEFMGVLPDDAPIPITRPRKPKGPPPWETMVKAYDYFNADGELIYQVTRHEPKDFRQRRPDPKFPDRWIWNLSGIERVLYRLPQLLADNGTIYLVEGEKDADAAVERWGLNATTSPGGAEKFTPAMARSIAGRDVVIIHDNDKPNAKGKRPGWEHAKKAAAMLRLESCRVKILTIPEHDLSDWIEAGAWRDDLFKIQAGTPEWAGMDVASHTTNAEWPAAPANVPENEHEMLANYVVLIGSEQVWDRRLGRLVSPSAMKLAHGRIFKYWSESDERLRVDADKLVFKPEGEGPGELNLFRGLPELRVVNNNAARWQEHLELLVGAPYLEWALARLAFKVQNPHVKVGSSLVLHGKQGTGKNLLMAPLLEIFGPYGRVIGQTQIQSPYTDWLSGKLFMVADEVAGTGAPSRGVKNKLKALITSEEFVIDAKYQAVRWERNLADIHFLSNEDIPVPLDTDDRRFAVFRCDVVKEAAYYKALASVDPAAVKEALLALPVTNFDPNAAPPKTTAKGDLVDLVKDSSERFVDAWLACELPIPTEGAIAADLYRAYDVWCKTNGERLNIANSIVFGRRMGERLTLHHVWANTKTVRAWAPGDDKPRAADLDDFRASLDGWIDREQRSKL